MQRKSLEITAIDDSGKGLARLGSLSAVDHDGDTYQPGAFMWKGSEGQWAPLLPSHDWRAMPFGKARVYEEGDAILAELSLNLDCQPGRDWHAALKFDLAQGNPVQEWSYGFNTLDADYMVRGDSRVRLLKRQDVMEVSPVLRGAGIDTGTVALKNAALKDDSFTALIGGLGELGEAIKAGPAALSASGLKQLTEIHGALGDALKALAADEPTRWPRETDAAVAGYLKHMARRHLQAA